MSLVRLSCACKGSECPPVNPHWPHSVQCKMSRSKTIIESDTLQTLTDSSPFLQSVMMGLLAVIKSRAEDDVVFTS